MKFNGKSVPVKLALASAIGLFILLGAAGVWLFRLPVEASPSFTSVKEQFRPSETVLLDRNGEVIHSLRRDKTRRRFSWVSLPEISPPVSRLVMRAEDRRFYQHHGVDWLALARSAFRSLTGPGRRGASTITMQVAAHLHSSLKPKRGHRTLLQKWRQVRQAWALESQWTKEQLLEAYLNLVYFRGELQGIHTASKLLFNKSPHALTEVEALLLAALIRSPNASASVVAKRACWLADGLVRSELCASLINRAPAMLSSETLPWREISEAPHVASQVTSPTPGVTTPSEIKTTLDRRLQMFAREAIERNLLQLKDRNVSDGAVLVVDNQSGEILAYVGSSGELSQFRHVDGVRAFRQAGSTLKPLLYGIALEKEFLTSHSLVEDSPVEIAVTGGTYRPRNFDNQFYGMLPLRVALASSLNTPAVRTLMLVGVPTFLDRLEQLGFSGLQREDFYGPSAALGSVDVKLMELVNAYRTLANAGQFSALASFTGEKSPVPPRPVFTAEAAFLIADILSDPESRALTFGLESALTTPFWTAVKTGTSKDMRDNWCVGFSDRFTVGVWVGNFSGASMWNVTGVSGAAPVWSEIMRELHRVTPSRRPEAPAGIVLAKLRQGGRGFFIRGTEPAGTASFRASQFARISYPTASLRIALDPDIPINSQRVLFEAVGLSPKVRPLWELDGKKVSREEQLRGWIPKRGPHLLLLRGPKGDILDQVRFSVRGSDQLEPDEQGRG